MRFVAVFHSWHVHSKGFEVLELKANNEEDAEIEARAKNYELNRPFAETDYTIVKITDKERLMPRKLTWGERFSGQLSQNSL